MIIESMNNENENNNPIINTIPNLKKKRQNKYY